MSTKPLTLAVLRYTSEVARRGSFTAAARECGVSQPTVSNAIADLEDALGVRLFERSTKRLAATPAGDRLVPLVQGIVSAVAELEREARAIKAPEKKLLRIGFSPLVGAQRLGLLFEPFVRQIDGLEIVYKECAQDDMESRIDAGAVDVVCGVGLAKAHQRARQLLYREPLRYIAPNGTTLGEAITLREIARARLVLTVGLCGLAPATRALFAQSKIRIDEYAGQAMSYSVLEDWAELGIGGAVLPASFVRKARSAALVRDGDPIEIAYEAVWRKDLLVADHTKAFARYVRTTVPRLVKGLGVIQ
jgi:DNA-binding transcriptional LysR family regulator